MATIPQDLLVAAEASIDEAWTTVPRPSDQQLVECVMLSYGVPHGVAEEWLCDFAGQH